MRGYFILLGSTAAIYVLFALITFGFLLREGRSGLRRRVLQAGASIVWPFYWITVHGFSGTAAFAARSAEPLRGTLILIVGMLSFTAYSAATQCGERSERVCLENWHVLWNNLNASVIAVAIYVLFALITFGYLFRANRPGLRRAVSYLAASALWPLYWITFHGITGTFAFAVNQIAAMIRSLAAIPSAIVFVFTPFAPAFQWAWVIGMVSFPAYYLATQWGACSGWGCLGTLALSVVWAPFWPVYAAMHFF